MGKVRFVDSATVKLELSEGDWLEVKQRISYGEQQRITTAGLMAVSADGQNQQVRFNYEAHSVERLYTWIVDWSFKDAKDKPVKVTRASIGALDPETVTEIDAALGKHIEGVDAKKAVTIVATGGG